MGKKSTGFGLDSTEMMTLFWVGYCWAAWTERGETFPISTPFYKMKTNPNPNLNQI
jgi:hypothetical protein